MILGAFFIWLATALAMACLLSPKGAATDNGIWDVKVGDLSSIAAIVGRLPFRSDILNDGRGIVCISWTADQNDY
jgi:hypothetical protein